MSPKEKATDLMGKFSPILPFYSITNNISKSKQCVLISVDEILSTLKSCLNEQGALNMYNYYKEVKQEIQKL